MTISNEEAAARTIELLVDCPLLRGTNEEFWRGRDPDVPSWIVQARQIQLNFGLSTGEQVLIRLVVFCWNGSVDVLLRDLLTLDADTRSKVFDILIARYVEPKSHPNSK